MINYLLIGTIWCAFLEFIVRPQIDGHGMNMATRIFQICLWPLGIGLFLYGYFLASKNDDDSLDN